MWSLRNVEIFIRFRRQEEAGAVNNMPPVDNDKMAILTIGLPVYNAMPFLPEAMQSLLAQDYEDFNILVIDDGSTDEGPAYLKSVKDPRVHVERQENKGLTFTLNRMLREVDTPWLVRHDADDIVYPERVRLTMQHIQRYPEAGMFYSHATYYNDKKHVAKFRTTTGSPQPLEGPHESRILARHLPSGSHPKCGKSSRCRRVSLQSAR